MEGPSQGLPVPGPRLSIERAGGCAVDASTMPILASERIQFSASAATAVASTSAFSALSSSAPVASTACASPPRSATRSASSNASSSVLLHPALVPGTAAASRRTLFMPPSRSSPRASRTAPVAASRRARCTWPSALARRWVTRPPLTSLPCRSSLSERSTALFCAGPSSALAGGVKNESASSSAEESRQSLRRSCPEVATCRCGAPFSEQATAAPALAALVCSSIAWSRAQRTRRRVASDDDVSLRKPSALSQALRDTDFPCGRLGDEKARSCNNSAARAPGECFSCCIAFVLCH